MILKLSKKHSTLREKATWQNYSPSLCIRKAFLQLSEQNAIFMLVTPSRFYLELPGNKFFPIFVATPRKSFTACSEEVINSCRADQEWNSVPFVPLRLLFAVPTQGKVNSKIQLPYPLTQMLLKPSLRTMLAFRLLSELSSVLKIAVSPLDWFARNVWMKKCCNLTAFWQNRSPLLLFFWNPYCLSLSSLWQDTQFHPKSKLSSLYQKLMEDAEVGFQMTRLFRWCDYPNG